MRMTVADYEKLKLRMGKKKLPAKRKQKQKAIFVLPWPPSVNQMYATTKEGKRVLSKKAVQFYRDCEKYLMIQNVPHFYNKAKMLSEFFPKRNSGWDESNFSKATEDALVKNQIIPDDQVKYLKKEAAVIHKKIDTPFIRVTLEEV